MTAITSVSASRRNDTIPTNLPSLARMFSPQVSRSAVGFDRMFDTLDTMLSAAQDATFPPHDIVKLSEDTYEIRMAVAGYERDALTVELDNGTLKVSAAPQKSEEAAYLHRGISSRAFRRSFALAEYMEVGDVTLHDGILSIALKRVVPDAMKPRRIKINGN